MAKELEAQKTPVAGQMAGNMAASPNKAAAEDTLNLPVSIVTAPWSCPMRRESLLSPPTSLLPSGRHLLALEPLFLLLLNQACLQFWLTQTAQFFLLVSGTVVRSSPQLVFFFSQ